MGWMKPLFLERYVNPGVSHQDASLVAQSTPTHEGKHHCALFLAGLCSHFWAPLSYLAECSGLYSVSQGPSPASLPRAPRSTGVNGNSVHTGAIGASHQCVSTLGTSLPQPHTPVSRGSPSLGSMGPRPTGVSLDAVCYILTPI